MIATRPNKGLPKRTFPPPEPFSQAVPRPDRSSGDSVSTFSERSTHDQRQRCTSREHGPAPVQCPGAVHQGLLVRESELSGLAGGPEKQPTINIQINVTANAVAEHDFEVALSIEGKAETDNLVLFAFELIYAGVFRIQNVPQDSMHPFIMIECPRLLFPFAREIIATSVRSGGFPPLMLDPVDFVGLYRQNMARQAEQQQQQVKPS